MGGRAVVSAVDARVAAGCVLGLVGVNGSGKSTPLRVPAGGHAVLAADVLLDGVALDDRRAHRCCAVPPR